MSNRRRLPKAKTPICRECRRGNHTGHSHQVCPRCEGRLEPGKLHLCIRQENQDA
jgi:hypothetical protein